MQAHSISFIGGGNMAASLLGGLVADGWQPALIQVAEPDAAKREALARRFGIRTRVSNCDAADADLVVLAVKPQVMAAVCRELGATLARRDPVVLSIAAGVRCGDIRRWLGYPAAVARAMPNTPALVGSGATGIYADASVDAAARDLAESVLRAVGMVLWVEEESLLDAVTALSGSGPAYFFLVLEALAEAAAQQGLAPETARLLALQTGFGAAKMALESAEDPAVLRARVTSPGGTTERAVARLEAGGLRRLFAEAMEDARRRAVELGTELGAS